MKIGDVSKTLRIPISTIRYYERKCLLGPIARTNGIREFSDTDIYQLEFIQKAQLAGFSLDEIQRLLEASRTKQALGPALSELANKKREGINQAIQNLKDIDKFLILLTECRCPTLEECNVSLCMIKDQ